MVSARPTCRTFRSQRLSGIGHGCQGFTFRSGSALRASSQNGTAGRVAPVAEVEEECLREPMHRNMRTSDEAQAETDSSCPTSTARSWRQSDERAPRIPPPKTSTPQGAGARPCGCRASWNSPPGRCREPWPGALRLSQQSRNGRRNVTNASPGSAVAPSAQAFERNTACGPWVG